MFIRIDISTGVPIWHQIVQQITRQVVSGGFPAGSQLSTVRELARELRVNPNTVARAYQDLERDGIVETRRGSGTFACDVVARKSLDSRMNLIAASVDALIAAAINLDIEPDDLTRMVADRVDAAAWTVKPTPFSLAEGIEETKVTI